MSFLERDDAPPTRTLHLRDEAAGLDATVVVDHELFPVAAGGTRMLADVDDREVARLARAMTWKFALYRFPLAGAKAGIRFRGGDRAAVLAAYHRALEPLGPTFLTRPDMGTSPADFIDPTELGSNPPLWAREHEGLGMDDLATGHGVKAAAATVLERLGRPLERSSVAIEGFGKVGAGMARACDRAGARVVAVSTVEGALLDERGLDVEQLLALRARHGDAFVHHADRPARPREELFAALADVLVPGARPDAIGPWNVPALRCRAVVPIANAPYAPGAVEALHARGVLAVPDFVTNAGGVQLYEHPDCTDDPERCLRAVEAAIAEATARVLDAAEAERETPVAAAVRLAREFLYACSSGSASTS